MLYIVATPISDPEEITLRALKILKIADVIVCESTKETSTLLKRLDVKAKRYELLNEHTTEDDLAVLEQLCLSQNVVLVSDCGTPSFCDPGFQLVNSCRKAGVEVKSVLGASSLMGLISLSSEQLKEFLFRGFLPAENQSREQAWKSLQKEIRPIVLMDTPYRLKKLIDELLKYFPERKILLAMNMSDLESEQILEGSISDIKKQIKFEKAEFMVLIYASTKKN